MPNKYVELNVKGQYKELLDLAESDLSSVEGIYWKITALHRMGNYKKALNYALSQKSVFENAELVWKANYLNSIGVIYASTGELDNSIPYLHQSLQLREELGAKKPIADSSINFGNIYHFKGDLTNAMRYYKKSLELYEELESSSDIALALNNMGNCFYILGDHKEAIEYHNKSLKLREEIGNKTEIAMSLNNLGISYHALGEFEEALIHQKRSLEMRTEIDNPHETSTSLLNLVETCLLLGRFEEALKYSNELTELEHKIDEKTIQLNSLYTNALILKSSKRNKDKVQAQVIFENIAKTNDYNFSLLIGALFHLVELLVYEYKSYEEKEVLNEIENHVERISQIAVSQKMHGTLIDVKILQSRLSIIDNDFDRAFDLLNEAKNLGSEKGLHNKIKVVEAEIKQFSANLTELKQIITSSSAATQLEKTAILDYLDKVLFSVQSF